MRVVIDSNVWISALVFGGNPRLILKAATVNGWTILVSEEILTEIRRVLGTKFERFSQDFEELVEIMKPRLTYVKLGSIKVVASRDDDDNRVIETALIGGADYLISGDKDLLVLGSYEKIKITSTADFLKSTQNQ